MIRIVRMAGPVVLAFLITITGLLAQSGTISIDSSVDKSTIRIGDLIVYTVTLRHDPQVEVQLPELGSNLGSFEIRDYHVHDQRMEENQTVEQIDYTISTFDTGEFEIPPVSFFYRTKGDTVSTALTTQPIKIIVESLKPSEAGDIRDVKAPHELPRDYRQLLLWGGIALALLLLAGIAFYIWYRRRLGKSLLPAKQEPQRPVHEIALEELQALQMSGLLSQDRVKEHYVNLSEIIRRYLGGRYFILAMELTSFELERELRKAQIEPEHIGLIMEFMTNCDMVKFAKYIPADKENEDNMTRAVAIVETTKLVYLAQPAENAATPAEPGDETPQPQNAEPADQVVADESVKVGESN